MNHKTINNKRIVGDKLRITEPTVLFGEETKTIATHEVSESEICRIDLIADLYYDDPSYSELILKFNNISNPFSITVGDVLDIPDHLSTFKAWVIVKEINPAEIEEDSIKDQFLSSKRLTVKDKNRVDYLKKKAALKNNGAQPLPPNILQDGASNLDIIDGNIII